RVAGVPRRRRLDRRALAAARRAARLPPAASSRRVPRLVDRRRGRLPPRSARRLLRGRAVHPLRHAGGPGRVHPHARAPRRLAHAPRPRLLRPMTRARPTLLLLLALAGAASCAVGGIFVRNIPPLFSTPAPVPNK